MAGGVTIVRGEGGWGCGHSEGGGWGCDHNEGGGWGVTIMRGVAGGVAIVREDAVVRKRGGWVGV